MLDLLNMNVNEIKNTSFKCKCGKTHKINLRKVIIKPDAINELPNLLKNFEDILLVADKNTYNAAGKNVESILSKFNVSKYVFQEDHLYPSTDSLGKLLLKINIEADIIIGVGSGTINDICKMISYKLNIPYIIVATAPSMDGYASTVSPIISNNVEKTYNACYPRCIIGDLNILKNAPSNMIRSGIGDIIGKYTALTDWKISKILSNEYYCDYIANAIKHLLNKCVINCIEVEKMGDTEIKSLMEMLVFSGLAIGMVGSSRPASGEEHNLSHCIESYYMEKDEIPRWLHGNYVGVFTGVVIEAYKFFIDLDLNKICNEKKWNNFNYTIWSKNIKKMYKSNSNYIIGFKKKFINFDKAQRRKNVMNIKNKEHELKIAAKGLIDETKNLKSLIEKSRIMYNPKDIGIDRETFIKSFIAAKDIQNRYGIFQLLEDLNVLDEAAKRISCLYYD
ncbi:MAG: sn-glycerol-1-phosphate dehydrogenase [Clostridium sp.]|nr:sn-glycerol-1-phosphate dehydrogenase [Clostridium sp.]